MSESVGKLGEFGLIEAIRARLAPGDGVLLGPGDDAAVIAAPDGRVVATTDLLVQDRHFRWDWSAPYDVGRKAAAANLADVAAMGARPVALLVGLGTPPDFPAAHVLALTEGLRDEAALTGAAVAGGDVVAADTLVIAVSALGVLDGRVAVTRSGARPGDLVAVCGRLGWSAAGLALLSAPDAYGGQGRARGPGGVPDVREPGWAADAGEPDWAVALVDAHRAPSPSYDAGPAAAQAGATAMCDVSDGLLADLGHIAAASRVGIELAPGNLPVPAPLRAAADRLGMDPMEWMLTGGEDHALVACFPPAASRPDGWQLLGRVVAGAGVQAAGYENGPGGWDHFR